MKTENKIAHPQPVAQIKITINGSVNVNGFPNDLK